MKTIALIVGLAGSGKTYLGKNLSKISKATLIDDIKDKDLILQVLEEKDEVIVTDPHLIDPKARDAAEQFLKANIKNIEIIWIFFDNDPEQCIKNVQKRNDGRKVLEFIKESTKRYKIPEGIHTFPVYGKK